MQALQGDIRDFPHCRTDSGGAREATAENLLQAGYGRPCSEGATQDATNSSAQALAVQELSLQRAETRIAHRKLLQVQRLSFLFLL